MDKQGFTLIEILVVLAITAVLASLAIVYTHTGQDQVNLSIEESKVAQLILEAKELSVATYSTNSATCAYGVHFDFASSTYSLFEYNSAVTSSAYGTRPICPSLASTTNPLGGIVQYMDPYSAGSWQVHTAPGVELVNGSSTASTTAYDILFYPPDPFTMISLDDTTFLDAYSIPPAPTSYVYLSTVDGSAERTISVNAAGQVSL